MNARSRSDRESPRDGEGQPHLAGWVGPRPPRWAGAFAANSGDSAGSGPATPPNRDDPRFVKALEAYLEALRDGRPWSRDEFLAQHTEIAAELGECISVLEFIQTAGVEPEGTRELAADLGESIAPRIRLGDYHILREVGRGGMGVVYEAQQISLSRRVALKVLPPAAAIDPKRRQRFQIEAQAAAQLHHPHIVPIFGVGCDHGIHYYAMQFVDGHSLAAIIHDLLCDPGARAEASVWSIPGASVTTEPEASSSINRHDPGHAPAVADDPGAIDPGSDAGFADVSPGRPRAWADDPARAPKADGAAVKDRDFCRNAARLGVEAADALDHAHGLGILHRDIKPANLLIDPNGAVWITDFGLARFPCDFSLTGTGDVVGTLRYMSPEQALARRGVVDQRSDIYSLGASLYELLTLRPAFDGRDHQELLRQIATDEPVAPRRLNPAIPRDLETIVLKAMAKDPSQRYATAQELAADLSRFLADDPILARRPGVVERGLRWARRHRELVATAAAVVVVSLSISTALIWAQARQTKIQASKAVAAAKKADEARNAYHAYMIESYPLIDKSANEAIGQAFQLAMSQAGPASRKEALQIFDQWVKILENLSELPRTDRDSRIVIGRARARLGYTRVMLSMAKPTPDGNLDPRLLSQAREDYGSSIALFKELLAASPGDLKLRRYLADAAGVYGMGCCDRFAGLDQEAESWYRHAIEIRRDLARGIGAGGFYTGAGADVAGEVSNFTFLVATVQILADMEERAGRRAEAGNLFRQLEDDVVALAARFSGPERQGLRKLLADPLVKNLSAATPDGRRTMIQNCRWALILDPEHPYAANNLAWALAVAPNDPWFDPIRAVDLARKAVASNPMNGDIWNTLGVAAFRVGDWGTAAECLSKSNRISGGTGVDCFFLAMTCWHQGKREEARQWFDQAVARFERTGPEDPELRRFHVEAAALLGLPSPQPQHAEGGPTKADVMGKSGHNE